MKSPAAYATAEQQADLDEERADLRQYDRDHPYVSPREDDEMSVRAADAYERWLDGAA